MSLKCMANRVCRKSTVTEGRTPSSMRIAIVGFSSLGRWVFAYQASPRALVETKHPCRLSVVVGLVPQLADKYQHGRGGRLQERQPLPFDTRRLIPLQFACVQVERVNVARNHRTVGQRFVAERIVLGWRAAVGGNNDRVACHQGMETLQPALGQQLLGERPIHHVRGQRVPASRPALARRREWG